MVRFSMGKRQKYQRPAVFATGTREKLWKVRFREYFIGRDGKEAFRNKSATWSRADHTKVQAPRPRPTSCSRSFRWVRPRLMGR